MEQKDYYSILEIEKDASPERIKEAFRDLAFKYHPDRNASSADAVEMMKSINEAYAVLSNPDKRKDYDAMREQYGSAAYNRFRSSYTDQDIFRGSDIHNVFEEMAKNFGMRGFDEIFKQFDGQGYKTFEAKRPGFHVRGAVFSGWMGGGSPFFSLGKHVSNVLLGKTGARSGKDIYDTIRLQPELANTGGPYAYHHQKNGKRLVIRIPAGVRQGQKIRLAGMGEPGQGGAPPGDLYLKVGIRKPLLQQVKGLIDSFRGK